VSPLIFLGIYAILKQKSKQNFSWEMTEPARFFGIYAIRAGRIDSEAPREQAKIPPILKHKPPF
jgi:hypothetical protein